AHVQEPPQELSESQPHLPRIAAGPVLRVKLGDRLAKAVAFDEPHGVERPAVAVAAESVDRHNTGVLQPGGDFRLEYETRLAARVVSVLRLDLLERHLTV